MGILAHLENIVRAEPILLNSNLMSKKKLFVGNLKYSVTEGQLRALFSQYGKVLNVKVMAEKGYAFIDMGTPEEAQKIKETLSESVFQGRRLLIDGVPSKQSETRKWAILPTEPRSSGKRQERGRNSDRREHQTTAPAQPMETVHYLTDVTEEIKKNRNQEQKSERPEPKTGQNAIPRRSQKPAKPVPTGREPEKSAPRRPGKEGPDHPNKKQSMVEAFKKTGEPKRQGGEPDKKSLETKPKKIKEKPPKNPHPYQGSKKTKASTQQKPDREQSSNEAAEDERMSYLRHMTYLAGKK